MRVAADGKPGRRPGVPSSRDYVDAHGHIRIPDGITLTTLIDRNVAEFSDELAYRFVDYSQHSEGRAAELTWRQMGARSRAIAARLQQVTSPDDRVAILTPQGLDYVTGFFGALQAGTIAVPLFAPEFPGHAERLEAVLSDARPSVILTTTAAAAAIAKFVRMMPREQRPRTIAVDELPDSVGAAFTPITRSTDDVAYLQYSSGSTRVPAGVEITHRAVGTNLLQMILTMELEGDYDMNGVSWLPLYHDMGLMMMCFPVLDASHLTLMAPVSFIRRPQRWIQVLSAEARTSHIVSPAPNFAFDLVVQRGIPRGEIDLSDVILINGSEPVHIGSIQKFTETFLPRGLSKSAIRPSYGMAEATLFVSSVKPGTEPSAVYLDREKLGYGHAVITSPDDPNGVAQVSCGRVAVSQWAAIVDPETGGELPDGEVGEIWLHGANIGRGYWARPEETRHTFANLLTNRLPAGSHAEGAPPEATWLRTGDLGVYLDGELYITGRIKDMIVLDGRNHYPQDIEATAAEASGAVRVGYVAAFAIGPHDLPAAGQDAPGEKLVIVAERAPGHGKADPHPVIDAVRRAVSRRHGINVFDVRLVAAGSIPRTTSGKLARRACRAKYLDGTLNTHDQAISAQTSAAPA